MNFMRQHGEHAAGGVTIVDEPDGLFHLRQPGCSAVIWRKQTPPHIQSWLDTLEVDKLPSGRIELPTKEVAQTIEQLCAQAGMPAGPERDWLQSDIQALAAQFAELMGTTTLRLRLDVVTTNACRKFHVDALTARLICTYRGTGTQYGLSTDGGDPNRVFTVQTGTPFLMTGTLWPERAPSGLLHRSPPIEGTGETRLVLVLDPVFDADEDT